METWEPRSRHILRLNEKLIAPLILFLSSPSKFTSQSFEKILSVLHDIIPQDLVIDPLTQNFSVSTSYTPEKPFVYSSPDIKFCYYWTPIKSYYSLCTKQENINNVNNDDHSSKKSDRRTSNLLFERKYITDMEINVCVFSDEKSLKNNYNHQHQISQFFDPKSTSKKKKKSI